MSYEKERISSPNYPFVDNMQFCSRHNADSDVIDVCECLICYAPKGDSMSYEAMQAYSEASRASAKGDAFTHVEEDNYSYFWSRTGGSLSDNWCPQVMVERIATHVYEDFGAQRIDWLTFDESIEVLQKIADEF